MRYAPTIICPYIRYTPIYPYGRIVFALLHTPYRIHPKLHYYNITCNVFLVGSLAWLLLQNTKLITKKISLPYYLWARRFDVMTKHFAVWLLLYKGSYTRRCVVVYLHNVCARYKCRYINSCGIAYSFLLKHNAFGRVYLHNVTAGLM